MKIAITGHSAGIGEALANVYANKGHEVVGLSRRIGLNIRNLTRALGVIEPCDVLINNAQVGFAQTELFVGIWQIWRGLPNKMIINISSMITLNTNAETTEVGMEFYRIQKLALEKMHWRLRELDGSPKLIMVKPGAIATESSLAMGHGGKRANTQEWANFLVDTLESAGPNLGISEIALGPA